MADEQSKKILFGASFLGVGALLSKILGAIYRIPLTNLLGGRGLGMYQMIFPVYCILLDFAGAGAPSAISKIISSYKGENKDAYGKKILKSALKLFALLGGLGSLLMIIFSYLFSYLQGEPGATLGYIFMSPSIFFVSLVACYRGYFQGMLNMKPTAVSQVIEQIIKLIFGLILVKIFIKNINFAVAGATLAVTISELFCLAYLFIVYKRKKGRESFVTLEKIEYKKTAKKLLKTTLPITLIGIAIPLSQFIDSFLITNILSGYRQDATALYGLYSGSATTIINLPIALLYGISTVAIPVISSLDWESKGKKRAYNILLINMALSLVMAVVVFFTANLITNLLFYRLSVAEKQTIVGLIKLMSANVVLLSFTQVSNAVLIGKGKLYTPLITLSIGVAIKTVIEIILLFNPKINIYASVIASITCYFVVSLLNLKLINGVGKRSANYKIKGGQPYY